MTKPLYALPDEDAPIREWCRPLSARVNTRGQGETSPGQSIGGKIGAMRRTQNYRQRVASSPNPENVKFQVAILSAEQQRECQRLRCIGWTWVAIAREMGVSANTARRAVHGREPRWKPND